MKGNKMKPIPSRQPVNTLVVYLDTAVDAIRQIRAWVLDPIRLDLNKDTTFWNSKDIIENNFPSKVVKENLIHFIKSVNSTRTHATLPYVVFWDHQQEKILKEHIPTFDKLVKGTVILQDRCRDIFKYDLRVQNFSLTEIAEVMGYENQPDCVKIVLIAHRIEKMYKANYKTLRNA
jgi:hypothetical protein